MEKRTESDILLKELRLKFGETEYVVPVLRMRAAAKWREQFFEQTKKVSDSMSVKVEETGADKAVSNALMQALLAFPEAIPNLVFSYATELPKEKILEEAYDQEFLKAFKAIWGVAFQPFLASLGMAWEMQKAQESSSRSLAGLN